MKRFLSIFTLSLTLSSIAQPPDFNDLVILFAEEDYEKCLKKAERYTDKDDTRKEPLPYLYISKCYFEINKDGELKASDDDYKRAFGNALKHAANFKRKDKENVYKNDEDVNTYFEILKGAILEDVDGHMNGEKPRYSKAASELKRLVTFDPNDAGGWLLKAACNYHNRNKNGARMDYEEGMKILENLNFKTDVMRMDADEELSDITDWEKELEYNNTARLLMIGIIEAAKMKVELRQEDQAKELLNLAKPWFEEVDVFMTEYNTIING